MTFWRRLAAAANALFSGESPGSGESDAEAGRPSGKDAPSLDVDFTIAVIALGAKLAKADGHVTPDERAAFMAVFQPPKRAQKEAERVFALAEQTTLGFEGYARRLARRWRAFPALLEDVLDGLFAIAAADGFISPDEVGYLERVAEIFGLSEREFRRIKASWAGPDADDPYLILGVDPDISDDDLIRAYRRAAAANHPDRIVALGLPEIARRLANAKMSAINAAYTRIRKERGLDRAGNR
jgi:DnaJ like chaperone protein